jgi:crooked neck
LKEERAMLLEEWLNKEVSFGDLGDVSLVQKKAPRKVKRKRPIPTEDGSTIAYALYSVFPFCISFSKVSICKCSYVMHYSVFTKF